MKKLLLTGLTLLLVVSATAVVFGATGGDDQAVKAQPKHHRHHAREAEPRHRANEPGEDKSGREAEPADDRGNEVEPGDDNGMDDPADDVGEDISGPCDEAEHANDPQCTGTTPTTPPADDDDAGEVEDNSGPSANSGPGNADDDSGSEDNSGPSGNSGPGGGDDSGSSGHGGGDDD
jgi:hypothetical protein